MPLCRDAAATYLAAIGYNVVRLPQEGINPLDLVGTDGTTMRLGTLSQLITNPPAGVDLSAKIQRGLSAANVTGQRTSKLSASLGVHLLEGILGALAGSSVSVAAGYSGARTIQFAFNQVTKDTIDPLTVGSYLRDADIDVGNKVLERYVLGAQALYLIVETLKARDLTVTAETNKGGNVAVDADAIKDVGKGKLTIDASASAKGTVSFKGEKDLVFGFRCYRVGIVDGFLDLTASTAGEVALDAAGAGAAYDELESAVLADGPLFELQRGLL